MDGIILVGRQSSHFTRVARIFAVELGVEHALRPVRDLLSTDAEDFGGNPALKIPVLLDADGALYGTENICAELVRRAGLAGKPAGGGEALLRGAVRDRVVANAEELTLHAMSAEVSLIILKGPDRQPLPPKVRAGLVNALDHLDRTLDSALQRLPERRVSFLEAAIFALVTHVVWRRIADVAPYPRLTAFVERFAERESAKRTEYAYDFPRPSAAG